MCNLTNKDLRELCAAIIPKTNFDIELYQTEISRLMQNLLNRNANKQFLRSELVYVSFQFSFLMTILSSLNIMALYLVRVTM